MSVSETALQEAIVRLAVITEHLETVNIKFDHIDRRIEALSDSVKEEIDSLQEKYESKFKDIEKKFQDMDKVTSKIRDLENKWRGGVLTLISLGGLVGWVAANWEKLTKGFGG